MAQDPHFEVYSQIPGGTAQNALLWFEQLRTFFQENGLLGSRPDDKGRPLRVVGFRSTKEYDEYRLRSTADAAYLSDEYGDYIVMASLQPAAFCVAAHEYAHYVLHANGLKLPPWLNEGLAEFFSTLKLRGSEYQLGGDLPARAQTLRREKWLPLAVLLGSKNEFPIPNTRKDAEVFYAQSWALVDMLTTSTHYSANFRELVSELNVGSDPVQAFRNIYGESVDEVAKRLENWVGQTHSTRGIGMKPLETAVVHGSNLSELQTRVLLAQLSQMSGHLERARNQYEDLSREEPGNPNFPAALGTIALRQGDREEALKRWGQALRNGTPNAELCYRYAVLCDEAGLDAQVEKAALERAVALSPGFDDARYKLALLQNREGEYSLAVEQLRSMRVPGGARGFAYWLAMASALTELDQRDEAKTAAQEAVKAAQNEADREQARRVAYIASTDLTVQFATDSEGHSRIVTTRVPHGTTDWNPFMEASDRIERANGKLSEVLCTAGKLTGFLLHTAKGPVTVEVPDPLHVLLRNGPAEFFCGPMPDRAVTADFAVTTVAGVRRNLLRGMEFQ